MTQAREQGSKLLSENREHLINQIDHLIGSLQIFERGGTVTLLIDRDKEKSSATDTRLEKRRFVTNANVWTTLNKAASLGLIGQEELNRRLGRSLVEYKNELLDVFGDSGIIINSLEERKLRAQGVVLDFTHVYDGFWSFSTEKEIGLFQKTADAVINDPRFRDDSGNCFFISPINPKINSFERFAVASYHGRTVWPAFNVEFADRLMDLSRKIAEDRYQKTASAILKQIESYIVKDQSYPEALESDGRPYSTWIYRSAKADSWFPRFMSVRAKMLRLNQSGKA
jgi:hypothetical protein